MSWGEVKKAVNSDLDVPLNHLIWMNDYKTYGEKSYVYQNKDILNELYTDPLLLTDPSLTREALKYIFENLSEPKARSIIQKYYYKNLENLITNGASFAYATDEEIELLTYWHYYYNLDLTSFWSVGDKRNISLSAMSNTGVGESQDVQTVEFAIAGFDHDSLTTAINGYDKAAITLTQTGLLKSVGYMNSSSTNVGGWTSCARRTWCNNIYYNALPSVLRTIVKPVNKLTSDGNQSATINTTSDKVFLFSEIEIFGAVTHSKAGEGTQYEYYKTEANRKRSNYWWERSPQGSNSTHFCLVSANGSANYGPANDSTFGLSAGLCI